MILGVEYEIEELDRTEVPVGNITEEGIRMALRGMKNNKALG
jgi:hypothetical protein